ncbi:fasciclin domain-containing protein, partial [Methanoculleus taiwanensis]|uniref:fasciclin domain-containing protein n=1 Tax=Methanoculleus taiwanensis TaxID=1550565 RepID=UPI0013E8B7A2
MAASIGEGNVTLNSSGNFIITPVNSSQPYIVSNVSVLGALQAGSEAGGFNYTVADDLPAERGYLTVTSIDEIENDLMNDTPMNWTYLINGEQATAGVAQKRVSDGDNVTFIYGSANDTQMMPEYTLTIFVSVTGGMAGNQTMGNVTGNQTMGNVTGNMTVVEVIDGEQNLTTLSAAINATNLTEPLSTGGPYTVFAPDDDAFDELGNETIEELLNDTENLTEILQYHVVEGNYTAEQLMEMVQQNMTGNQTMDGMGANMTQNQTMNQTDNMTQNQTMDQNMTGQQEGVMLQTLLGENLTITLNQTTDELMVNNATVVTPDLNASNGVVHIIDQVLMPPNMTTGNQTMDNMTGNQTADGNIPNITVTDQPIVNDSVIIKEAVAKRDNWVVIHADQNGAPGPVIGMALIARGVNDNITVQIETENATKTLYAMLHNDAGMKGVFEFPGSDRPETVMGEVVVQPFNVTMGNVTDNQTMDNVTDNQT